ncbi:MAG: ATP-binding cassette domain-containing protein, partial [Actinobacteria bacterium]|nr:ATP-binding cassette domain-containing protein [Actinomycetota bacterium]
PAIVSDSVTVARIASGLYIALAAVGLNFAVGLAGLPSLGQGAFAAAGAFGAAWLRLHAGWEPASATLAGVAIALGAGTIVGVGAVRLRGVFVAVSTWITAWLVAFVLTAFTGLSGGSQGLVLPVERVGLPGAGVSAAFTPGVHYELALVLLALALVVFLAVARGPSGLAYAAVREGPAQASALGVDRSRLQLGAFVAAAGIGGLAGALSVQLAGVADPAGYGPLLSVELFVAVVLGGEGRVIGPAVGAALLALIPGAARGLGSFAGVGLARFEPVLAAALLVVGLLLGRGGAVGLAERAATAIGLRKRRHDEASPAETQETEEPMLTPRHGPATLAATEVSKRFGGVVALDAVSIRLDSARVHALVGPNGSGKTTLLRALGGTVRPDGGRIVLDDVDLTAATTEERARAGVVRTLQRTSVFEDLTAVEHVMAGATVGRSFGGALRTAVATPRNRAESREIRARAEAILGMAGMEADADVPAHQLDAGAQRLLVLCTAYASLPSVMLLDEPSAGMEAGETRLERFLRALADLGVAVLVVEHDFHLVNAVAQEVTVLDAGHVVVRGTPEEVRHDPEVQRAYLGG